MCRGGGRSRTQLVRTCSEKPQDSVAIRVVLRRESGAARSAFSDNVDSLNAMPKPSLPSLRHNQRGNHLRLALASLPCPREAYRGGKVAGRRLGGTMDEHIQVIVSKSMCGFRCLCFCNLPDSSLPAA